MTFKIDDVVWLASFERRQFDIQCPDCCGTRKLKITFGDGTEAMIDCAGCEPGGYEPPRGTITQYEWTASAMKLTISEVTEKKGGAVEYRFAGHYSDSDGRTFATEQEAIAKADELKAEYQAEENRRYLAKTKQEHTWSWNATYHRRQIKQAEKDLAWHQSKLVICQSKSKEAA